MLGKTGPQPARAGQMSLGQRSSSGISGRQSEMDGINFKEKAQICH